MWLATTAKVRVDASKSALSAFRRAQPTASIAFSPRWVRFAVAQAVQRRDPGLETAGDLANVG
jgi:hypothetical protein